MKAKFDITFIIPCFNEEENVNFIYKDIYNELKKTPYKYQILYINDGSTDSTDSIIEKIAIKDTNVRCISLLKNIGKARALEVGFLYVESMYTVIMDGDYQYRAKDALILLKRSMEGFHVVNGYRINRKDKLSTKISSKIFNNIIFIITGLNLKDSFSGLKCLDTNILKLLALQGRLYRFATFFAAKNGFNILEIEIEHYPRTKGITKYNGLKRVRLAIQDIATILLTVTMQRRHIYYLTLTSYAIFFALTIIMQILNLNLYLDFTKNIVLILLSIIIIDTLQKEFYSYHKRSPDEIKLIIKRIVG